MRKTRRACRLIRPTINVAKSGKWIIRFQQSEKWILKKEKSFLVSKLKWKSHAYRRLPPQDITSDLKTATCMVPPKLMMVCRTDTRTHRLYNTRTNAHESTLCDNTRAYAYGLRSHFFFVHGEGCSMTPESCAASVLLLATPRSTSTERSRSRSNAHTS